MFTTTRSERGTTRLQAGCAFLLAAVVLPGVFAGAGRALPGGSGPGQTRPAQERSVHGAPPARPQQDAKLDSRLGAVAQAAQAHGDAAGAVAAQQLGVDTTGSSVRVIVDAADPLAAQAAVAAAGATVEASAGALLRIAVAPTELIALAQSTAIRRVRLPLRPQADAVGDEGVASTGASWWQLASRTGAGVKLGIVDLGFAGYTDAQASGDLPLSLTAVDECGGNLASGQSHGTAVASVAYKMAPGAQLYLICIADEVDLANAEAYARANGITVINHSVSWFNSSRGDGRGSAGTPDAIVKDARSHGILWVNAAGNYGRRHVGGPLNAATGRWQTFPDGFQSDPVWIPTGGTACAFLKWDDWSATAQDYDLYLWNDAAEPAIVASSVNAQWDEHGNRRGAAPPTEDLCFANHSAANDDGGNWFYAGVSTFHSTRQPRFDLYFVDAWPWFATAAGSVTEPGSSPDAFTVGATCVANNVPEPYSSRGPTVSNLLKPDISGPDGTSSVVYGNGGCDAGGSTGGFAGTSAASAHVAGAAALVEALHPTWTPAQVQAHLTSKAVDLGAAGRDTVFGAGALLVTTPPRVTSFSPAAAPVGATVTITGANMSGATAVSFNGVSATPVSSNSTSVKAVVPPGASTGKLAVTTAEGPGASKADFKVSPRVTGLSTSHGVRLSGVSILGSNFTGATRVTFNGRPASFSVAADGTIDAVVPADATTGKVAVTTSAGTGTGSAGYTVVLKPAISSFSPSSARPGTVVTVNGANLLYASHVTFPGGVDAPVAAAVSQSRLTVVVPEEVALAGKLTVTNDAATSTPSGGTFRPLPSPAD